MNIKLKDINNVNYVIENELKFESVSDLYSWPTKDPLSVVTVSLRVGKKYMSTVVSVIIAMWDSGANSITIKSKHTRPCDHKMRSNKV